jgi:ABC-2 type transport system permease protein
VTATLTPTRPARRLVQIGAFVRKEVAALLRQPRLLVVLVAGPFIILLLFAVGYDQQQAVLRTAFVGPAGSIYETSIDQFADGLEQYVDNAGYSDDLVAAEQRLSAGEIDAVVVFPADPLDSVLSGEQATITVLHDKIDPIQQVAVEVSSQVAVMELNARVLEEIVARAQDTLVPVDESLARVDDQYGVLADAIDSRDLERIDDTLTELRDSTASIDRLGSTSTELADAFGADEATRASLDELDAAVAELAMSVDDLADRSTSLTPDDATELRAEIDQVSEVAATAATIDPAVVVRPFASDTASLQREPIEVNDYFAPAAVALLLQHMVLTFAAMSLVTDRTLGMFEVFRVGPIDAARVMAGKYLAFMLVGAVVGAALLASMVAFLGLPMRGATVWVVVGIVGLLAASIGFGLVLSLLARSDVQAVQFAMLALLAGLFFGGFFLDLEAFTYPVKLLSWALPVTYGIRLLRDVMLRGADPSTLDLAGLAVTTIVFGLAAWSLLHRQLRTR